MRLLSSESLQFKDYQDDRATEPYAILSHTWEDEEVTFQDMLASVEESKKKKGFEKIEFCAERARKHNLRYFWVDTCCIDKSNSTELSEAINSMYRWYRNADVCF